MYDFYDYLEQMFVLMSDQAIGIDVSPEEIAFVEAELERLAPKD